jgi:hypothetical protein
LLQSPQLEVTDSETMLKGDKDYEPNPEHYLGSRWTFTLADLEQDAEFRVTETEWTVSGCLIFPPPLSFTVYRYIRACSENMAKYETVQSWMKHWSILRFGAYMEDVLIYRYIQYILFGYMSHILVYDIYEFNVLNLKGWFFLIPSHCRRWPQELPWSSEMVIIVFWRRKGWWTDGSTLVKAGLMYPLVI